MIWLANCTSRCICGRYVLDLAALEVAHINVDAIWPMEVSSVSLRQRMTNSSI